MAEGNDDAFEIIFNKLPTEERYAEAVLDCTSRYNSLRNYSYSPMNIIGKPKQYPMYGDFPDTYMPRAYGKWWSDSEGAQKCYRHQDMGQFDGEDYITVKFELAVVPSIIKVYEIFNPGAIVRIWGRFSGEKWRILWQGAPQKQIARSSRCFIPPIRRLKIAINEIRLDFNFCFLDYYTALDGVLLCGKAMESKVLQTLFSKGLMEVKHAPRLHKKNVFDKTEASPFSNLPYEVIVHIFQYLDLTSLCRSAQVNKIWNLAARASSIYRCLSLKQYWDKVDDLTLKFIEERCRNIRKLDLSWCGRDRTLSTNAIISFLQTCCKHLTHLSLCHATFVFVERFEFDEVLDVISTLPELVEIRLRDSNYATPSHYTVLAHLRNLTTLDLASSNIRDDALISMLKANRKLEHLNIELCEHIRNLDAVAEVVATYNRDLITWSSWKTDSISPIGVNNLSKCVKLRELDLGWCWSSDPENCFENISRSCTDLRRLILSGWRGLRDHKLFPVIKSCTKLTQLDLMGIKNISGDICQMALTLLPKLQLLDISFCLSIQREQVAGWRRDYPDVVIQRSCEYSIET